MQNPECVILISYLFLLFYLFFNDISHKKSSQEWKLQWKAVGEWTQEGLSVNRQSTSPFPAGCPEHAVGKSNDFHPYFLPAKTNSTTTCAVKRSELIVCICVENEGGYPWRYTVLSLWFNASAWCPPINKDWLTLMVKLLAFRQCPMYPESLHLSYAQLQKFE